VSLSLLLVLALAAAQTPATPPDEAPLDEAPPAVEVTLDLPLGLLSREAASRARADVSPVAGLRVEGALHLGPWVAAAGLGTLASLPEGRGTGAVSFTVQQNLVLPELRLGYRLERRSFILEPFATARGMVGARLQRVQVLGQEQASSRLLYGGGIGLGLGFGYGRLRLRFDVGGLEIERDIAFTSALAIGVAFP